jgi:UrcA family protein
MLHYRRSVTGIASQQLLNLDQPRDIARLASRISAAADNVCGPRSFGGYFPTADYKACYSDAVTRAVARIDRPSVSTYFQHLVSDPASRKVRFAQQ